LKVAIVSINQPSFNASLKLSSFMSDFDVDIYAKEGFSSSEHRVINYQKLDDIMGLAWQKYDAIIAILAIGAVVRKIAPFLKDKSSDPAVLVIDLALSKIVPLLSGHLGGANELANLLARRLQASVFISTATDQTNTLAFDMVAKKRGWRIENIKCLAKISNNLLNKKGVKVATYESIFDSLPKKDNLELIDFESVDDNSVVISPVGNFENLTLRPKIYIGIGCNQGTTKEEIEEAFAEFIENYKISKDDIALFASFEAKSSELGLLEFVESLGKEIKFFKKGQINSLEMEFSSSASKKFFGIKGVAEPSAILASHYKELIIKKVALHKKITLAGAI
jgi:cobalt-precorrin 5A hydrolase